MLNDYLTSTRNASGNLLTGVFNNREAAELAYDILVGSGYNKNDINIMMSDETRDKYFTNSRLSEGNIDNKALEGLGVGSAIGGAIAGFAAAVAAIGTVLVVPGLGLVIAGPLAAGLAGAGAGGIAGGLTGALVGSGIPGERAKEYEEAIKAGGIVIAVQPKSDDDYRTLESKWENINS